MPLSMLVSYYTKQIDSIHVAMRLFSSDHAQNMSNVVKTSVTNLAIASCATFLFFCSFVLCNKESVC